MRKILKLLTSRLILVAPLVALQFFFIVVLFYRMTLAVQLLPFMAFAAILIAIYVINRDEDPAYKIGWCLVILGAPVIGIPLYLLAGNRRVPKKLDRGTTKASVEMDHLLLQNGDVMEKLEEENDDIWHVMQYGLRTDGFPIYQNTNCQYFKSGEDFFPVYLDELRKAKSFILMEYFIVDEGEMWNEILKILKEKVSQGVKVKLIYDDFGSITLPQHYDRTLTEIGIETYRFNHVRPAFIIQMNNRDHRKCTVIDNRVAFTGGLNLADEYINRIERFGYWKDSAIMLKGDAVWSFTVMFLGMLSYCRGDFGKPIQYLDYKLPHETDSDGGYYQPYSDTPTDDESTALIMHVNLVSHAKKYVYIDTPYLILNETMKQALLIAAKTGVDVRILVPYIADKKIVFQITKGFYKPLIKAGVRIYEYLPGFNHCKNFVVDDTMAIVGSANTDYRSYFLHFENGVLMSHTPEIIKIKENFIDAIAQSHEVTLKEVDNEMWIVKVIRGILNMFIPLV